MIEGPWTHHQAVVNGVRLHYVEAGVEAGRGPLVILLHGFPEFWYSWRFQIPALISAGFRVIALDMRGYNLSEKPPGVAAYRIKHLSADVAALIRHVGGRRAVVVGHDWGGAVAWAVAARYPERVGKLVVMNAPHPAAFARELKSWKQIRKSWYILFFQLPWLPELLFRLGGRRALEQTLRHGSLRPELFTDEDLDRYTDALLQPGALRASINYYRAAFRAALRQVLRGGGTQHGPVTVPTLLVWGEQDEFLDVKLTQGLEPFVPHLRLLRIRQASHWVQIDAHERVNEGMLEFLKPS